jgi:hypothetical protein
MGVLYSSKWLHHCVIDVLTTFAFFLLMSGMHMSQNLGKRFLPLAYVKNAMGTMSLLCPFLTRDDARALRAVHPGHKIMVESHQWFRKVPHILLC